MQFPIDIELESFGKHLSKNSKVFFSGRYGIGKTSFLREFFKANTDKYEVVRLAPVNYSIVENHEVFELLKADILMQLITKDNGSLDDTELNHTHAIWSFFIDPVKRQEGFSLGSQAGLLAPLLNLIPKIGGGGGVYKMYEAYEKLFGKYMDFAEEFRKSDKRKVEDYLKEIGNNSIYESDWVSVIITELIEKINKGGSKKVVLWIDDLDRLDPAHIFRIINILCAHTDTGLFNETGEPTNKFGFQKVVLTGDLKNIRSVFHHFYGSEADFKGYMDKFYDEHGEIYQFNFERSIIKHLNTKHLMLHSEVDKDKPGVPRLFNFIVKVLLEEGVLNTRSLIKSKNLDRINIEVVNEIKVNQLDYSHEISFPEYAKWLSYLYGDFDTMIHAIEILSKKRIIESWNNSECPYLVELLAPFIVAFIDNPTYKEAPFSGFNIENNNLTITYRDRHEHQRELTFKRNSRYRYYCYELIDFKKENDPEVWKWFYYSLLDIQRKGIVR